MYDAKSRLQDTDAFARVEVEVMSLRTRNNLLVLIDKLSRRTPVPGHATIAWLTCYASLFPVIPRRRIQNLLRDATRSFDRPCWQAVVWQEYNAEQVRIAPLYFESAFSKTHMFVV
jgi:hypothetical protein